MTDEQMDRLGETLRSLGADAALVALAAYASARTGRHFEVNELPPLTEAEKAEIETLAAPETFQ